MSVIVLEGGTKVVCSAHYQKQDCDSLERFYTVGHRWLRAGDLAYYDSIRGPVKVKIKRIERNRIDAVVTDRSSSVYPPGEEISTTLAFIFTRTALMPNQTWSRIPVWFELT